MRRLLLFMISLLSLQVISAQSLMITGKVTSADDSYPLPGVSIFIDGTTLGTYSDADGNYSINVQSGQTLVFSSIGFLEYRENIIRGGSLM